MLNQIILLILLITMMLKYEKATEDFNFIYMKFRHTLIIEIYQFYNKIIHLIGLCSALNYIKLHSQSTSHQISLILFSSYSHNFPGAMNQEIFLNLVCNIQGLLEFDSSKKKRKGKTMGNNADF